VAHAFDKKSTSVIKLDSGLTLYLREIEHMLALVCLVKEDNFDRQNLIDFNIDIFKDGVKQIFQAHDKMAKGEENKV
jgi:Ras-related GTP-binding protein C/D